MQGNDRKREPMLEPTKSRGERAERDSKVDRVKKDRDDWKRKDRTKTTTQDMGRCGQRPKRG